MYFKDFFRKFRNLSFFPLHPFSNVCQKHGLLTTSLTSIKPLAFYFSSIQLFNHAAENTICTNLCRL